MSNEEKLSKVQISCDTGILWKIHSNLWKYWTFDVEIFTYFNNTNKNRLKIQEIIWYDKYW